MQLNCTQMTFKQEKHKHQDKFSSKQMKKHHCEVEAKQQSEGPSTPAVATVSTPTEAQKEKPKKKSWWKKLFRIKKKSQKSPEKEDVADSSKSSISSDTFKEHKNEDVSSTFIQTAPSSTKPVKKRKKSWWHGLCCIQFKACSSELTDTTGTSQTSLSETATTVCPQDEATHLIPDNKAVVCLKSNVSKVPRSQRLRRVVSKRHHQSLAFTSLKARLKAGRKQNHQRRAYRLWLSSPRKVCSIVLTSQPVEGTSSCQTDTEKMSPPLCQASDEPSSKELSSPHEDVVDPAGTTNMGAQTEPDCTGLSTLPQTLSTKPEALTTEYLSCQGLPNLAQTCYMNSTLQGLLTLTHFTQEIYNQLSVWSSNPCLQLMREFVEIGNSRFTNNWAEKESILTDFKDSVALFNPEFEDHDQKDAHEFLSCVLNQMRSLSPDMDMPAVGNGIGYTCPVDAHIMFEMLSIRSCKGCGDQSITNEINIDLSLDLDPGCSVSRCFQDYLKETEVEYRCTCGSSKSSQRKMFLTMPNVLIIQLKRFTFTHNYKLKKKNVPINLSRDLAVNDDFSLQQTHYSLVSIISHLGKKASFGHYVCDGIHRQQEPSTADRWLTYDDEDVTVTTGESVCQQRRNTAYLLFYEKRE